MSEETEPTIEETNGSKEPESQGTSFNKPITPKSLFGGSASVLKEAELEAMLKSNGRGDDSKEEEAELPKVTDNGNGHQKDTDDAELSNEQADEAMETEPPKEESEEKIEPNDTLADISVDEPVPPKEDSLVIAEEPEDEPVVEQKKATPAKRGGRKSIVKQAEILPKEKSPDAPEESEATEKTTPAKRGGRRSAAKPAETSTPARRSTRITAVSNEKPPATTPAKRGGRQSTSKKVEEISGEAETEPQKSTTSAKHPLKAAIVEKVETPTRRSTRRPAVEKEKSAEQEDEEEEEKPVTPKSSTRTAKKPVANTEPRKPVPKRVQKVRKSVAAMSNLDPDDPFNFTTQLNTHPEPLGNLNVRKSTFGEMKFLRSPNATDIESRYSKTEQAASRSVLSTSKTVSSSTTLPSTISELSTTPSARRELEKAATPSSKKRGGRVAKSPDSDIFEPPGDKERTPKRGKRESSVTLSSKKAPAILVAPELSAEEQQQADFAHEPWPVGTRVFSLWGHEYYPAIIAIEGRDGVGRYKVIFTEDGQNRDVPANGLIPLSSLAVGNKVSTIVTTDDVELEQPVEIVQIPDKDNLEEWNEGIYDVKPVDTVTDEATSINWKKLLITKVQQKEIINVKNTAVIVTDENVVPRSSRRSRVVTPSITATPTPKRTRAAPKTPAKKAEETEKTATPTSAKKRGRQSGANRAEPSSPPTKRTNIQKSPEKMDVDDNASQEEQSVQVVDGTLFAGKYFMLTSSARRSNAAQFNKREFKGLIEERGGVVAEEIGEMFAQNAGAAFLIADTFYRTHKYLFALAASIPCVHFSWINECVKQSKLVDHTEFLLPSGSSVIDNKEYPWRPLKGELMKDKVIFVHSSTVGLPHENVVPFAEIWRPLLETLGATVITTDEKETSDVMDFCDRQKFDVLLTDRSCPQEIISHVNVPVISSNWIIHTIVTGEFDLETVGSHESFSP